MTAPTQPRDVEEEAMHPMFVTLFLDTDADDLWADDDARRARARRRRSRIAMKATIRQPSRGS
jgi:hypothetical protein